MSNATPHMMDNGHMVNSQPGSEIPMSVGGPMMSNTPPPPPPPIKIIKINVSSRKHHKGHL
jgi:hypothetical protein